MKHAPPRPLAYTFFPALIGLLFLLVGPLISLVRMERYHNRIEDEIDPVRHQILNAIQRAYQMRSDMMSYTGGLQPVYVGRYQDDKAAWRAGVSKITAEQLYDPKMRKQWQAGVTAMEQWVTRYADGVMESGAQGALPKVDSLFSESVAALDGAGQIAERDAANLRERIRALWQMGLITETAMGCVCLLLALLYWRNVKALRDALDTTSQSAKRLAVAVKETNHRVKNNLQTIGALIDMHAQEHGAQIPRRALDEISQQVQTVAAVHDFLSHERRENSVAMQPMLQKLVGLAASPRGLQTELRLTSVELPVKEATSIALIANELVLNAGKHGAKRICVTFTSDAGQCCLRVADDGPGLPEDFSVDRYANLGLTLVTTLATHDLGGQAVWRSSPTLCGAEAEVIFPIPFSPCAGGGVTWP